MNHKLAKGLIAGAACVALAAGGGTLAAWSDFDSVDDNAAAAGMLKLNVSEREGAGSNIDPFDLVPGQNKAQSFYLASADAANSPDGMLTAKITNLVDTEDGGPACTTNSEQAEEGGACGTDGELSEQMRVQILASGPVDNASSCPNTGGYGSTTPSGVGTLASKNDVTFNLGVVGPGQGVCVRIEGSLPISATNAVQGDQASWDWRFDLVQVTP